MCLGLVSLSSPIYPAEHQLRYKLAHSMIHTWLLMARTGCITTCYVYTYKSGAVSRRHIGRPIHADEG